MTEDINTEFIRRAVAILEGFAINGMSIDGYEEAEDFLAEMMDRFSVDDWNDLPKAFSEARKAK